MISFLVVTTAKSKNGGAAGRRTAHLTRRIQRLLDDRIRNLRPERNLEDTLHRQAAIVNASPFTDEFKQA